ncbi:MAG TPA: GDSL-type esterase/lipase family protein [Cryobacterium sp.]|nr:GDSL-type esterase/lipase family protein [Cryobacterium sp.]
MSASVLFIGDGLTANGLWSDWLPEYDVHNLGAAGKTTDEVVAELDQVVDRQPDAVVMEVGTNDLGWHRSDEYIVRNMETLLCALRKRLPAVRILVVSVPPRERELADTVRSINLHLRQFAPTQHAQYLDLWARLARPDGEIDEAYSADRLHLNDAAYEVWLNELKPALEFLFERPPSSTAIPIQQI